MKQKSLSNDLTAPQPTDRLIDGYKKWLTVRDFSENTIKSYLYCLKAIPEDVESYFSNKELKAKRLKLHAYRSYLRYLTNHARVIDHRDLAGLLTVFKYRGVRGNNKSERKWSIPRDDWSTYIKNAPNKIAKMGMWLGFQFGLRNGEIVHLRINDVSFENEEINIRPHAKTKTTVAWNPKHNRARFIPFVRKQTQVLKKWIKEERPTELTHNYLLWTPRDKNRVTEKTFWYWVKKTGANPHILRYSFATNLYELTKDIGLVQGLLGHANVSTTSGYLQLGHERTMQKAREAFINM